MNLEKILQLIKELATPLGILALLLLAVIIFMAADKDTLLGKEVASVINVFTQSKNTEAPEKTADAKVENTGTPTEDKPTKYDQSHFGYRAIIKDVQLTPVTFDVPTSLYFEVANDDLYPIANAVIAVDVGRATFRNVSIQGSGNCKVTDDPVGKAQLRIACDVIDSKTSVYVYVMLSESDLNRIVVNSPYFGVPVVFSKNNIEPSADANESELSLYIWLKVLLGIGMTVLFIYFLVVAIILLNKVFKI